MDNYFWICPECGANNLPGETCQCGNAFYTPRSMFPLINPNSGKIILDLCGGSGSWTKPYKDAGYDVRLITLPDNDVTTYTPPENVYGIFAAPPCTEFSIAKDYQLIRDIDGALKIVDACLSIIEKCNPVFWALENPTGLLRQYLPSPVLTFHPWQYGDAWTKKTDIWGNFNVPAPIYTSWADVPKLDLYIRPGRKKPSIVFLHKSAINIIPQLQCFSARTDADFRAITPPGFARAFYEVNK